MIDIHQIYHLIINHHLSQIIVLEFSFLFYVCLNMKSTLELYDTHHFIFVFYLPYFSNKSMHMH